MCKWLWDSFGGGGVNRHGNHRHAPPLAFMIQRRAGLAWLPSLAQLLLPFNVSRGMPLRHLGEHEHRVPHLEFHTDTDIDLMVL